ncbi:RING finger and transmembrane domain-containing protein 2-like [Sycon ciliatum]|uniref:RING finger and transmembrane domain-containing protein 2-like n=1 Tax=Sycon ciliatum TaxID=27933 RepID=UPI0020A98F5D|eukprot:scpid75977/ scgid14626/ RING finger and transmembrane domain-containing protein 2
MASPRTHHRSASWTLGGAANVASAGRAGDSGNGSESRTFDSLRSVICEIVPGLSASSTSSIPPQNTVNDGGLNSRGGGEGLILEDVERGTSYAASASGTHAYRRSDSHGLSSNQQGGVNGNDGGAYASQESADTDDIGGGSSLQPILKWFEKGLPFCLLLGARLLWEYRLGMLVLAGLLVTYLHANRTIKRQVELKDRRSLPVLTLTMAFLVGNLVSIYYVFYPQRLQYCFYLHPSRLNHSLTNSVWTVVINDFAIKFVVMALKCCVAMLHTAIIPYRRKGKYYLLLENLSHSYRTLIPIPVWVCYFADRHTTGLAFCIVSIIAYVIIKCLALMRKARRLHDASKVFFKDRRYGCRPSGDALAQAGSSCPICQEDLKEPTMLPCRHIFCDDCVSMWFDRERTCPLCRALVADDPQWRDGATSISVHIF